ncbi:2-oxoacid:acceptor oxidoreductase family protein [Deferribacter thermophilus]|uniref:2-oxoacid:acceptor oxidoreductase family protein n=1 Tax=Deferribacter thermophilus TaxID=53573 RepID=UPI003C14A9BE
MTFDCIMAGFGGQGILSAGMILAQMAVKKGLNVTWWPSYGAEQRGGTANCTVVISDEEIGSPIVTKPNNGFIMNRPSLDKFQPRFNSGANVIVDVSLVDKKLLVRDDINFFGIEATEIANSLGNTKVANMVMIGALLSVSKLFELNDAEDALYYAIPEKYHSLLPINRDALKTGYVEVKKI